eukprot:6455268-Amphidinium_carterae.1
MLRAVRGSIQCEATRLESYRRYNISSQIETPSGGMSVRCTPACYACDDLMPGKSQDCTPCRWS